MSIEVVLSVAIEIADLISQEKYVLALQRCKMSRLNENELDAVMRGYGKLAMRRPN
jgi:hypothetical protein